ncbi:hypothetical protein [Phytohabitans rumicis]|nr:hypothetical protein [Phytohabitans rumicis]
MELLSTSDPDVFFDLNDIIRERGLPACRDLLAGRRHSVDDIDAAVER